MKTNTWSVDEHIDDMFSVRWRFVNDAVIEWELHMLAGKDETGIVYADDRHDNGMQAFENPQRTPIDDGHIMHGTLKFDGCMDAQQSNADCMMHFCERGAEPLLSKMMRAVYALGPKLSSWMN